MDCYIIWGNGIPYYTEIADRIQEAFDVLTVKRLPIEDMESFIKMIYVEEMKTIPHHIMAKNKHLLSCPKEAVLFLVKGKGRLFPITCPGHGPHRKRCSSFNEHFKQEIRDIFNPKQPNGERTEDHVIHGTSTPDQVENALKAFGLKSLFEWAIPDCLDWTLEDFVRNHQSALQLHPADEARIRQKNLEDVGEVFESTNTRFWLHGKTLLGAYRDGRFLMPDHDDDIGVFIQDRIKTCTEIYPLLKERGFKAVRNNRQFLSVLREGRYLDICFFERKNDKIGYGEKWFPEAYFCRFDGIRFLGRTCPVPQKTGELLSIMYPGQLEKKKETTISLEQFLDFKIETDQSINWNLRGPHLNLITDGGRLRKIFEIIRFFSEISRVRHLRDNALVETKTQQEFTEPLNLNKSFWQSGNNFFFNCIYYGFRKGVAPYAKANHFIRSNNGGPPLFSMAYFETLEPMTYSEIRDFLRSNPIVVEDGAIVHGQHRVCAMIGLLAAGNEYVPLCVE